MNNGFASPFFQLSRGVAKDIKGIDFDSREIKLSQYADDTTVFVADIFSAQKLK